jgi:hypothetical protein
LAESLVLRVANAFEQSTPWHKERPAVGRKQVSG